MDFITINFYLFLAAVVTVYYVMPLRFRWLVLLAGSCLYFAIASESVRAVITFSGIILLSWLLGLLQEKLSPYRTGIRKWALAISIFLILLPLIASKYAPVLYAVEAVLHLEHTGVLISLGLSFFTMQIIAYLVDIYRGKILAQHNLLKYALFVSFFPQILQGPIPRYDQLEPQLIEGHRFDDAAFVRGFLHILWGFFLKLMIADRANIIIETVYADYVRYQGCYVLAAGFLYCIQLYTDFLACFSLAQGIAGLFNIQLADNFRRPFFSTSVKEFWGRWHISLSSWLRDYIYIPLGGNRKGLLRKYVNLMITFSISGIWHGSGYKYLTWGLVNAGYQVIGSLTEKPRDKIYCLLGMPAGRRSRIYLKRCGTFVFTMLAFIIFRADTLTQGLYMLRSLFTVHNPWILLDGSLLNLGADWTEWMLLLASVLVLIFISTQQEKGIVVCDIILRQPAIIRWGLYISAIVVILVFGTYGYGFDAADFIYGGF